MLQEYSKKLTNICINQPLAVICYSLIASAMLIGGLTYLEQDDDMINLLPANIGSRKIFEEIQYEYGLTEYMYVAIGNKNTSILNSRSLKAVWDLTKEFKSLDSLVDDVISLSSFKKVSLDPIDSSLVINDLIETNDLNELIIKDITNYLNDNPSIQTRLVSNNLDYANIIIIPKNSDSYPELARKIHTITANYNYNNTPFEFHFGGQAYVTGAVPDMVQSEVKILLIYGLVLMCIILLFNLRSVVAVALILVIIITSMLSMFGFMGWIYHFTNSNNFYFTLMNTSMPIVLLTIANSVGVHIISRFIVKLRTHKNKLIAITKTMESLCLPIFLTSLTTALAFLMLIFSPVSAMMGYGITISFGIIWSWLLSNTLLPALITLFKWDPNSKSISQPSYIEKIMDKFGYLVSIHPKRVLITGFTLVVIACAGISMINVEVLYTKMFRKGNIIRDSAEFLDENLAGNVNLILRVKSDLGQNSFKEPQLLNDIEKVQNYLDNLENVKTTISINDVIKQLHKVIMDNNQNYYSIPNTRAEVNNLFFMYEMNDETDISSLINYNKNETIITALMKTFSTQKVPGYRDNIENFIKNEINNDNLKFELTGMMEFIFEFMWLVIKSSIISLILSIIVIFITTTLFFKSWRFGILSIIPLFSAVLLNFGLMGWFAIELTHLTALLSSIIIGVGVDFSIHYISEYRYYMKNTNIDNLSRKTISNVGHPIILDAWSNMAFGALLLSSVIPLAQIGGLMVVAMVSTSIGALTLLASALEIFKHKIR